jgi:hypothetical protein
MINKKLATRVLLVYINGNLAKGAVFLRYLLQIGSVKIIGIKKDAIAP